MGLMDKVIHWKGTYLLAWAILAAMVLSRTGDGLADTLVSLCILSFHAHVLYAAYFTQLHIRGYSRLTSFLGTLVLAGLVLNAWSVNTMVASLWTIIPPMVAAIILHASLSHKNDTPQHLRAYAAYKIVIESMIILSALGGLVLLLIGMDPVLVALLGVARTLWLHALIVGKKAIYSISYPDATPVHEPFFSLVVITLNEEKYIGNLLRSISEQSYNNFEVIVVDDNSEDRTRCIVAGFSERIPLRLLTKRERGVSASRNLGGREAKGDYILFLDADVTLPPDFLSRTAAALATRPLALAGFDFAVREELDGFDRLVTFAYGHWLRLVQHSNPRAVGWALMVEKGLFERTLFDESVVMSEDFDFVKRASRLARFRILPIHVNVSWRRFHKENRLLLLLKYAFFESYRTLFGEIRKRVLPYEFGRY